MADHIRLLQCLDCRSLETLPDFDGNPDYDDALIYALKPHRFPNGDEHGGHLMKVETKYWNDPAVRATIESQIREKSGHTGLDSEFYATKDTYGQDALRCFQKHHRNPECNDYHSDSKRLTPSTAEARKEAGLPRYSAAGQDRYLCDFCPVSSMVAQAERARRGMYK